MAIMGLFFMALGVTSLLEREMRAALIAVLFLVISCVFWVVLSIYSDNLAVKTLNFAAVSGLIILGFLSLLRFFPNELDERKMLGAVQYDERDNMFSRNNMQYYPQLMQRYYHQHPERENVDRGIHSRPEFGDSRHTYYNLYATPCFVSAFEYLKKTIPASRGAPAERKKQVEKEVFLDWLKRISRFYGACDVGVTSLKDYHLYSHRGRHADIWGDQVKNDHRTAIVIAIPMEVEFLRRAPTNSVIQESARKYVEVAKISNIIAEYIRNFGYHATAHTDANYETLCVPLAVDAGLGELGRLGLLIHHKYGPCVRLAVVTTELDLPQSGRKNHHITEFCKICKKCSDNCPTEAICGDDEPESRGFRHWSIDQEKCFAFWKKIGTDCGFCLAACPYTKPDNFFHKLVRLYVSRNSLNQRIALLFDDLLYGRKIKVPGKNTENIF
jgi:reductive dehalogenase